MDATKNKKKETNKESRRQKAKKVEEKLKQTKLWRKGTKYYLLDPNWMVQGREDQGHKTRQKIGINEIIARKDIIEILAL